MRFLSFQPSQREPLISVSYGRRHGDTAIRGFIAHLIVDVFISFQYMFIANRGGFASCTMGLAGTVVRDAIAIGDITLCYSMLKQ